MRIAFDHSNLEISGKSSSIYQSATISATRSDFDDLFLNTPKDIEPEKWNSYPPERKILNLYLLKVNELSERLFEELKGKAEEEKFDFFSTFISNISCHYTHNTIDQLVQALATKSEAYESTLALKLTYNTQKRSLKWKIKDNGGGVPAEIEPRLFKERDLTTKIGLKIPHFGGAGLGLSSVKNYCEKIDGKYGFRNNKIGGATFWFKIPLSGCETHFNTPEYQRHLRRLNSPVPMCHPF